MVEQSRGRRGLSRHDGPSPRGGVSERRTGRRSTGQFGRPWRFSSL